MTTDNFLKLVEGRGTAAATYVYSTVFRVEKVGMTLLRAARADPPLVPQLGSADVSQL